MIPIPVEAIFGIVHVVVPALDSDATHRGGREYVACCVLTVPLRSGATSVLKPWFESAASPPLLTPLRQTSPAHAVLSVPCVKASRFVPVELPAAVSDPIPTLVPVGATAS